MARQNVTIKPRLFAQKPLLQCGVFLVTLTLISLGIIFTHSTFTKAQSNPPIASYSFSQVAGTTLFDSSGNGYDGVFSDSPTWTAGKHGDALFYDGSDNVDFADVLPISGINKLTIMAWVKRGATNDKVEIGRQSGNAGNTIAIESWDDGNVYFGISDSSGYAGGSVALNDTNWHHLTLVFDGTQPTDSTRLKGYVDGIPKTLSFTGTIPNQTSISDTPFGLGSLNSAYSNGLIDDVRIYTLALSQAEIQADMNTPVGASPPPAEIWQVSVPDGGSYADPITSVPWELDGSSPGYLFTAITADAGNVYTARGQNGSWNSPSCSLQRWNSITRELNVATGPFPCTGIYKLELKINPADNIMRLFAYREGAIEIRDKNGLTIIATEITDTSTIVPPCSNPCDHTTTGVANGSIAKRTVGRSDGLDIYVEHSDTSGSPGNFGSANPLNLYIDADVTTLPTWISDVVPAPTTNGSWLYFGAEEIALSPAGDYLYIAGGNKVGGVLSSQIEKRELPVPPDPQVSSIISAPFQIDNGDNVDISWSSSYADYCDITTSPSVWSGMGLPANGYEPNIGPINPPVTFTALCTRDSDGKTGSASVTVTLAPNLPPQAVITNPASDIAINSGDTVVFDAGSCPSGSCDSDGSISAYEWREGDCIAGTLLSSASTFNKSYFTVGSYSTYLTVKDDEGAWSNCALITITMPPKCNNGDFDDDGDGLPDEQDPGCWTNPTDSATYNQYDDDENNCGNQTPPMCEKNFGENFKTCRLDCAIKFYEN